MGRHIVTVIYPHKLLEIVEHRQGAEIGYLPFLRGLAERCSGTHELRDNGPYHMERRGDDFDWQSTFYFEDEDDQVSAENADRFISGVKHSLERAGSLIPYSNAKLVALCEKRGSPNTIEVSILLDGEPAETVVAICTAP